MTMKENMQMNTTKTFSSLNNTAVPLMDSLLQSADCRPTVKLIRMNKAQQNTSTSSCSFDSPHYPKNGTTRNEALTEAELAQMHVDDASDDEIVGSIVERNWNTDQHDAEVDVIGESPIPQHGFPEPSYRGVGATDHHNKHAGGHGRFSTLQYNDDTTTLVERMTQEEKDDAISELESIVGATLLDRLRKRALRKAHARTDKSNAMTNTNNQQEEPQTNVETHVGTHVEAQTKAIAIQLNGTVEASEIHMDAHEAKKLMWTSPAGFLSTDTTTVEGPTSLDTLNSLRFHLNGTVLSTTKPEDNIHTELFHHGNHPHLPGYTLLEITDFWIPSTSVTQRLMGFQTMFNIMVKSRTLAPRRHPTPCTCVRHTSYTSNHDKPDDNKRCMMTTAFGFGSLVWDRYIFEELELHHKAWVSTKSNSLPVRLSAFRLLVELFLPTGEYDMCDTVDFISTFQKPSVERYCLHDLSSAYRRIVLKENTQKLHDALEQPDVGFTLDESAMRLKEYTTEAPSATAPTDFVRGLSAFDAVVQLLSSSVFCCNDTHTLSSLLANTFKQVEGDPVSELILIRFLTVFCLHSRESIDLVIFQNDQLIDRLKQHVLSLTNGTADQQHIRPFLPLDEHQNRDTTELMYYTLFFLQRLSTFRTYDGTTYLSKLLPDEMMFTVFIRQMLMQTSRHLHHSLPCNIQAFSTLITLEVHNVWKENIQCLFSIFFTWICEADTQFSEERPYDSGTQRPLTPRHPDQHEKNFVPDPSDFSNPYGNLCTQHKDHDRSTATTTTLHPTGSIDVQLNSLLLKRLTLLTRYLWTVVLKREKDQRLLTTLLPLVYKLIDTYSTYKSKHTVTEDIEALRFVLELSNVLTVLSNTLTSLITPVLPASSTPVPHFSQLQTFMSHCSTFLKCFHCRDPFWDIFETKGVSDVLIHWTQEFGLWGTYTQVPYFDQPALRVFLQMRLCASLSELQFSFQQLVENVLRHCTLSCSTSLSSLCFSSVFTNTLTRRREQLEYFTLKFSESCFCMVTCNGSQTFCGDPHVLRQMNPLLTICSDYRNALEDILCSRGRAPVCLLKDPALFSLLSASTVSHLTTFLHDVTRDSLVPCSALVAHCIPLLTGFATGQLPRSPMSVAQCQVTPLSCNMFFSFFRFLGDIIQLYYRNQIPYPISVLDRILTEFLFRDQQRNFTCLLQKCSVSTLIEQLLSSYSTLHLCEKNIPTVPMKLESSLQEIWGQVATQFQQEIQTQDLAFAYFSARLEQTLQRFVSVFKTIPNLPPLAYQLILLLSQYPIIPCCQQFITSDSTVTALMCRHVAVSPSSY